VIFNSELNPFLHHISHWQQYLDDIFSNWTGTETQLRDFHGFMNTKNKHLKFSMEMDPKKMNFLDILVEREGDVLKTNLYRNSTDKNSLLHGESYHPTSLKKNLPISQFNRIRRICSDEVDFQEQSVILQDHFRQRGYKEEWITNAATRFHRTSQNECLNTRKNKTSETKISCCIQYSPVGREI